MVEGVAYHNGRFGVVSEIKIFEEPLYQKKKIVAEKKEPDDEIDLSGIEIQPNEKLEIPVVLKPLPAVEPSVKQQISAPKISTPCFRLWGTFHF